MAASATSAQQPTLVKDCGSIVIVKCDAPAFVSRPGGADRVRPSREVELRRQDPLVQQLEGVVIEGEATRRRSIGEVMGSAFPEVRARDGNYTFATGEGSKCTCMNVCPPWPFACCVCSARVGR